MRNVLVSLRKTANRRPSPLTVCAQMRQAHSSKRVPPQLKEQNENEQTEFANSVLLRRKPFKNTSVKNINDPRRLRRNPWRMNTKQAVDHPMNQVGRLMTGTAQVKTPVLTDEEMDMRLNSQISQLRHGFGDFNGTGGNDYLNNSWGQFFEHVENVDPVVSESLRKPKLKDTDGWLFNKPLPLPKKGEWFQNHFNDWRQGKMMDRESFLQAYKMNVAEAPLFRKRLAEDPFRNRPYMARRVSYKNVDLLTKFLSPGGNILGRRYTGVTRETQAKITREIYKARSLGLLSYTGNPKFISEEYQPIHSTKFIRHSMSTSHEELEQGEMGLAELDDLEEQQQQQQQEQQKAKKEQENELEDELEDEEEDEVDEGEEDNADEDGEPAEEDLPLHPYLKEGYNPDKQFRQYMQNLQNGISPTGRLEWQPPPQALNPKHTVAQRDQEWHGGLPEQMEEKKKVLKEMLLENFLLKQYGHSLTKEKVKHLTQVLAHQSAATATKH